MSTPVQLNPTRLSIISVARDKFWLFLSPTLRLLYSESERIKTGSSYNYSDDEDEVINYSTTSNNFKRMSRNVSDDDDSDTLDSDSSDSHDNSSKSHEYLSDLHRSNDDSDDDLSDDESYFFHIAFTSIECTIICSTKLMQKVFAEPLRICKQLQYDNVNLLEESFVTLHIDSYGDINSSSSILELTHPLAENSVSLFFLSSHFGNIVLIPHKHKDRVINILTKKQFEFSDVSNSFIINTENLGIHEEDHSRIEQQDLASLQRIEENAFRLFKDANIKPKINRHIKLLLTGARSREVHNTILKTAKILSSDAIPHYFAMTRTSLNEISLVLPKSAKKRAELGFTNETVIGSMQDTIIPITIDFHKLPLDSTGIVTGVASRIFNGIKSNNPENIYSLEMNYLSMARSGIIMIPEENLPVVSKILKE